MYNNMTRVPGQLSAISQHGQMPIQNAMHGSQQPEYKCQTNLSGQFSLPHPMDQEQLIRQGHQMEVHRQMNLSERMASVNQKTDEMQYCDVGGHVASDRNFSNQQGQIGEQGRMALCGQILGQSGYMRQSHSAGHTFVQGQVLSPKQMESHGQMVMPLQGHQTLTGPAGRPVQMQHVGTMELSKVEDQVMHPMTADSVVHEQYEMHGDCPYDGGQAAFSVQDHPRFISPGQSYIKFVRMPPNMRVQQPTVRMPADTQFACYRPSGQRHDMPHVFQMSSPVWTEGASMDHSEGTNQSYNVQQQQHQWSQHCSSVPFNRMPSEYRMPRAEMAGRLTSPSHLLSPGAVRFDRPERMMSPCKLNPSSTEMGYSMQPVMLEGQFVRQFPPAREDVNPRMYSPMMQGDERGAMHRSAQTRAPSLDIPPDGSFSTLSGSSVCDQNEPSYTKSSSAAAVATYACTVAQPSSSGVPDSAVHGHRLPHGPGPGQVHLVAKHPGTQVFYNQSHGQPAASTVVTPYFQNIHPYPPSRVYHQHNTAEAGSHIKHWESAYVSVQQSSTQQPMSTEPGNMVQQRYASCADRSGTSSHIGQFPVGQGQWHEVATVKSESASAVQGTLPSHSSWTTADQRYLFSPRDGSHLYVNRPNHPDASLVSSESAVNISELSLGSSVVDNSRLAYYATKGLKAGALANTLVSVTTNAVTAVAVTCMAGCVQLASTRSPVTVLSTCTSLPASAASAYVQTAANLPEISPATMNLIHTAASRESVGDCIVPGKRGAKTTRSRRKKVCCTVGNDTDTAIGETVEGMTIKKEMDYLVNPLDSCTELSKNVSEPSVDNLESNRQLAQSHVVVPYGWKRTVANGAVVYYSPTEVMLKSVDEVRQYLLKDGTCKCGLHCPLVVDKTFIFDAGRTESRHLLADDVRLDLDRVGNLCNHRRKIVAMAAFHQSTGLCIGRQEYPVSLPSIPVTESATVAGQPVAENNLGMITSSLPSGSGLEFSCLQGRPADITSIPGSLRTAASRDQQLSGSAEFTAVSTTTHQQIANSSSLTYSHCSTPCPEQSPLHMPSGIRSPSSCMRSPVSDMQYPLGSSNLLSSCVRLPSSGPTSAGDFHITSSVNQQLKLTEAYPGPQIFDNMQSGCSYVQTIETSAQCSVKGRKAAGQSTKSKRKPRTRKDVCSGLSEKSLTYPSIDVHRIIREQQEQLEMETVSSMQVASEQVFTSSSVALSTKLVPTKLSVEVAEDPCKEIKAVDTEQLALSDDKSMPSPSKCSPPMGEVKMLPQAELGLANTDECIASPADKQDLKMPDGSISHDAKDNIPVVAAEESLDSVSAVVSIPPLLEHPQTTVTSLAESSLRETNVSEGTDVSEGIDVSDPVAAVPPDVLESSFTRPGVLSSSPCQNVLDDKCPSPPAPDPVTAGIVLPNSPPVTSDVIDAALLSTGLSLPASVMDVSPIQCVENMVSELATTQNSLAVAASMIMSWPDSSRRRRKSGAVEVTVVPKFSLSDSIKQNSSCEVTCENTATTDQALPIGSCNSMSTEVPEVCSTDSTKSDTSLAPFIDDAIDKDDNDVIQSIVPAEISKSELQPSTDVSSPQCIVEPVSVQVSNLPMTESAVDFPRQSVASPSVAHTTVTSVLMQVLPAASVLPSAQSSHQLIASSNLASCVNVSSSVDLAGHDGALGVPANVCSVEVKPLSDLEATGKSAVQLNSDHIGQCVEVSNLDLNKGIADILPVDEDDTTQDCVAIDVAGDSSAAAVVSDNHLVTQETQVSTAESLSLTGSSVDSVSTPAEDLPLLGDEKASVKTSVCDNTACSTSSNDNMASVSSSSGSFVTTGHNVPSVSLLLQSSSGLVQAPAAAQVVVVPSVPQAPFVLPPSLAFAAGPMMGHGFLQLQNPTDFSTFALQTPPSSVTAVGPPPGAAVGLVHFASGPMIGQAVSNILPSSVNEPVAPMSNPGRQAAPVKSDTSSVFPGGAEFIQLVAPTALPSGHFFVQNLMPGLASFGGPGAAIMPFVQPAALCNPQTLFAVGPGSLGLSLGPTLAFAPAAVERHAALREPAPDQPDSTVDNNETDVGDEPSSDDSTDIERVSSTEPVMFDRDDFSQPSMSSASNTDTSGPSRSSTSTKSVSDAVPSTSSISSFRSEPGYSRSNVVGDFFDQSLADTEQRGRILPEMVHVPSLKSKYSKASRQRRFTRRCHITNLRLKARSSSTHLASQTRHDMPSTDQTGDELTFTADRKRNLLADVVSADVDDSTQSQFSDSVMLASGDCSVTTTLTVDDTTKNVTRGRQLRSSKKKRWNTCNPTPKVEQLSEHSEGCSPDSKPQEADDGADSTTGASLPGSPRVFNTGDLIWGPNRGYPSWPGKLVTAEEVRGNQNQKLESGKIWVKWFGVHTFTQEEPSQLKTLSEGLETHHNALKKCRQGRKMNASLEAAIQEAMSELDQQSDAAQNQTTVVTAGGGGGSSHKHRDKIVKSRLKKKSTK